MDKEKRRAERSKMPSQLVMRRIDDRSGTEVHITVSDVSRGGIGFQGDMVLDIGSLYETDMTIWTHDVIHVFLEIVRIEKVGHTYYYGALFVGLSETDAARISVYQTFEKVEKAEREALMQGMSLE